MKLSALALSYGLPHRTLEAVLGELGSIILGSVLRTAVRVVDAPCGRSAHCDGGSKCSKRQTCIDPFADRIPDNSPSPGVQDRGKIDKAGRDHDVGDVGDP